MDERGGGRDSGPGAPGLECGWVSRSRKGVRDEVRPRSGGAPGPGRVPMDLSPPTSRKSRRNRPARYHIGTAVSASRRLDPSRRRESFEALPCRLRQAWPSSPSAAFTGKRGLHGQARPAARCHASAPRRAARRRCVPTTAAPPPASVLNGRHRGAARGTVLPGHELLVRTAHRVGEVQLGPERRVVPGGPARRRCGGGLERTCDQEQTQSQRLDPRRSSGLVYSALLPDGRSPDTTIR